MQRLCSVSPSHKLALEGWSLGGCKEATRAQSIPHQTAKGCSTVASNFRQLALGSRSVWKNLPANRRLRLVLMASVPKAVATKADEPASSASNNSSATGKGGQIGKSSVDSEGAQSTGSSVGSVIDFLNIVTRLKDQKRTGWILRNVKGPESIADHMYRMSVMALLTVDQPGINRDRCIKIAIAHDIAEAIVGDIAPADGVSKEEKRRREAAAMDEMCAVLGGQAARELRELWEEYEANASPEAKLVKDLDKVEMILQADEYEQAQGRRLQDFFDSTAGKFQTDLGKAWAAEIVARRQARLSELPDEHGSESPEK